MQTLELHLPARSDRVDQFPGYLTENESKLTQQDKDRYTKQQKTVAQIVAVFEAMDYSEEDPEIGLKVMSLMNEVCFPPN